MEYADGLITKEELTGYRNPTEIERGQVASYMAWKTLNELRPLKIWFTVCALLAACAFIYTLATEAPNIGMKIMGFVFLGAMCFATGFIVRKMKDKKTLLKEIVSVNFRLMDCKVYDAVFPLQLTAIATVWICNSSGQRCGEKFFVDIPSAKEWQNNPDKPFYLLKCGDCYEVLSERRMGFN